MIMTNLVSTKKEWVGPLLFAGGAVFLLLAFYFIIEVAMSPAPLSYESQQFLEGLVYGFIAFLLIGRGLWSIIRSAYREGRK